MSTMGPDIFGLDSPPAIQIMFALRSSWHELTAWCIIPRGNTRPPKRMHIWLVSIKMTRHRPTRFEVMRKRVKIFYSFVLNCIFQLFTISPFLFIFFPLFFSLPLLSIYLSIFYSFHYPPIYLSTYLPIHPCRFRYIAIWPVVLEQWVYTKPSYKN
jgi:hypothetical protein